MANLLDLGWSEFFEKHFQHYKEQGYSIGRISAENKNNYNIYTEHGEVLGEVSGKLIYNAESASEFPKTGDWVVISLFDNNTRAVIHDILPRKTKISRKSVDKRTDEQVIATNIDIVFIMQSLDNNFNLNRLERYLVAVNESGAIPIVLLSKADICPESNFKLEEVNNSIPEVKVVIISSITKTGLNDVLKFFDKSTTAAVIGSSGVGKSTLINQLITDKQLKTNSVRTIDQRGKHTTTRRELIVLPSGGLIIDTPGMREFALWNSDSGFSNTYNEFDNLSKNCRFQDCTHTHEIDCAVKEALSNGIISEERYNNYLKLRKELHYLETRQDKFAYLEEKRKWKNIHKESRRFFKKK